MVIAAPERDALREAAFFVERLKSDSMPLAGLVLNRVQEVRETNLSTEQATASAEKLEKLGANERLTAALLRLHADRQRIYTRQLHLAERFTAAHPGVAATTVPALAEDVHDLAGLREIGDLLATRLET